MRGKRFQLVMVKGSKGRFCTFSQKSVFSLSQSWRRDRCIGRENKKMLRLWGGPVVVYVDIYVRAHRSAKKGGGVRIGPPPGLYPPPTKRPKRIGGLSQRSRLEGRRETLALGRSVGRWVACGHFEFPVCDFFPSLPSTTWRSQSARPTEHTVEETGGNQSSRRRQSPKKLREGFTDEVCALNLYIYKSVYYIGKDCLNVV